MRVGVAREIKDHEFRVGLTAAGAGALVAAGHEVRVQSAAGERIGLSDRAYRDAGATVVPDAVAVYDADLVVKVKEPQPAELPLLRDGQALFCYLHLAATPAVARALLDRGVTGIAYETVVSPSGGAPLLAPMSQIAGRLAIQAGMQALEMRNGGRGVLLSGVPGAAPGVVAVIGGGIVGANAVRIATGIGARVTLLDRKAERLKAFDDLYPGRLETRLANAANIAECVSRADLVVGAVYVHGQRPPRLLTRELVRGMQRGAALVDVAIDQGGIAETSRPTTHAAPFYVEEGVVHYCVTNMPAAVARTATVALTEATLPYVLALAGHGVTEALRADPGLAAGLNVAAGKVMHAGLAPIWAAPDSAPPVDAQEILFLVVVVLELALVGGMQRVADVPREMDVGRGDPRTVRIRLDRDDALERMLRPLLRLPVPDELQDLVPVRGEELALERHVPRGKLVLDAMAGRARRRSGAGRRLAPSPAPAVVHGAALRAAARLGELLA
jgi:alanine dehydrogenase